VVVEPANQHPHAHRVAVAEGHAARPYGTPRLAYRVGVSRAVPAPAFAGSPAVSTASAPDGYASVSARASTRARRLSWIEAPMPPRTTASRPQPQPDRFTPSPLS